MSCFSYPQFKLSFQWFTGIDKFVCFMDIFIVLSIGICLLITSRSELKYVTRNRIIHRKTLFISGVSAKILGLRVNETSTSSFQLKDVHYRTQASPEVLHNVIFEIAGLVLSVAFTRPSIYVGLTINEYYIFQERSKWCSAKL